MNPQIPILIAAAIIWGDGIHDDTTGMEALVCQQPFRYAPGALDITYDAAGRQHIDLSHRTYVLPHGFPMAKGSTLEFNFVPPGLTTYEVDCKARAVS